MLISADFCNKSKSGFIQVPYVTGYPDALWYNREESYFEQYMIYIYVALFYCSKYDTSLTNCSKITCF